MVDLHSVSSISPMSKRGDADSNEPSSTTKMENTTVLSTERRFWRLLNTPPIVVLVGPTGELFHLHGGLLRKHSLFFRALLRPDSHFTENEDDTVKLPEDDVFVFACFAEWLYLQERAETLNVFSDTSGKVVDSDEEFSSDLRAPRDVTNQAQAKEAEAGGKKSRDCEHREHGQTSGIPEETHYDFSLQFACYVLGDKLQCAGFKNHILKELGEDSPSTRKEIITTRGPDLTSDQIIYVYRNTLKTDNRLRDFCMDVLFSRHTDEPFDLHSVLGDSRISELYHADDDVKEILQDIFTRTKAKSLADSNRENALRGSISVKDKKISKLSGDNIELEKKSQRFRQQYESSHQQYTSSHKKYQSLQQQYESLRQQHESLRQQHDRLAGYR